MELVLLLIGIFALIAVLSFFGEKLFIKSYTADVDTLKYNIAAKILAVVLLAFSLPLFIVFVTNYPISINLLEYTFWLLLFSALLLGFSVYFFLDVYFTYCVCDDKKVTFYNLWKGKKAFDWSQLKSAVFDNEKKWYVLTFNSGEKIRLSMFLRGFHKVEQFIKKYSSN